MTKKEKQDLAEFVYEYIEFATANDYEADADLIVNTASTLFRRIRKHFKLNAEIKECILNDSCTNDEDKKFLLDYIKS